MANEQAAWASHSQTQRGSASAPSIDATSDPPLPHLYPSLPHLYPYPSLPHPSYREAVAAKGQSNLIVWGQFQA